MENDRGGALASPAESPYQVLLDHLQRCFQAEEENSRRHADSTRLVVTALVAFLAVGLFRFGLSNLPGDMVTSPVWAGHIVRLLLILGIGCLFYASSWLTGVPSGKRLERLDRLR